MSLDLPEYYFRTRENGALAFRIETENRHRRIGMEQIAVINVRNGEIKPHGKRELTQKDVEVLTQWLKDRQALLAQRNIDDILRTVDHLNLTAQWAQSKAEDDELDAVTDSLLLAMHDLRSVLIRKKSDRLMRAHTEAE